MLWQPIRDRRALRRLGCFGLSLGYLTEIITNQNSTNGVSLQGQVFIWITFLFFSLKVASQVMFFNFEQYTGARGLNVGDLSPHCVPLRTSASRTALESDYMYIDVLMDSTRAVA